MNLFLTKTSGMKNLILFLVFIFSLTIANSQESTDSDGVFENFLSGWNALPYISFGGNGVVNSVKDGTFVENLRGGGVTSTLGITLVETEVYDWAMVYDFRAGYASYGVEKNLPVRLSSTTRGVIFEAHGGISKKVVSLMLGGGYYTPLFSDPGAYLPTYYLSGKAIINMIPINDWGCIRLDLQAGYHLNNIFNEKPGNTYFGNASITFVFAISGL